MESPGEHLKREREHRGVSLQKIFESTRVPMKYLEAIEADRVEGLPQPAFVKGYIRNYCKVLGLDENDAVLRYEVWLADRAAEAEEAGKPQQVQGQKRKKTGAQPAPEREFKLPPYLGKIAIIAVGVVLVIFAYTLTRRDLSVPEPQVQAPAPAPAALEVSAPPQVSAEALVPPKVTVEAGAPPQIAPAHVDDADGPRVITSYVKPRQPVQPAAPAPAPAPAPVGPSLQKPIEQPVLKPVQPQQPAQTQPVQKAPQPEPVKKAAPVQGAAGEEAVSKAHTLTAHARETVWLKVAVDKGEPVEVLLKQGERFTWKAAENISVIIGNAGGVTLTYNGKDISGLGAAGEVVGLSLPGGTSYKIKKEQPQARPAAPLPNVQQPPAPTPAPAINMPEVPAPAPKSAPGE